MSDGKGTGDGPPKRSSSFRKKLGSGIRSAVSTLSPGRKRSREEILQSEEPPSFPMAPRRLSYTQALQRTALVDRTADNGSGAGSAGHSRRSSRTAGNWRAQDPARDANSPYEGEVLIQRPYLFRFGRGHYLPGNIVLAWHNIQNVDRAIRKGLPEEDVLCYSKTNKNTWVHTKRRPFVVLWTFNGFMIATPMRTHGGRGLKGLSSESPFYNSHIALQWRHDLTIVDMGTFSYTLKTTEQIRGDSSVGIKEAVILDYREDLQKTDNSLTRESTEKLIELWLERAIEAVALDAERPRPDDDDSDDPDGPSGLEVDDGNPRPPPPPKRRKFNKETLKFENATIDQSEAITNDLSMLSTGAATRAPESKENVSTTPKPWRSNTNPFAALQTP